MRKQYQMTNDDMQRIVKASQPTPVMYLSGGISMGGTPQENANRAWQELGSRMGFDYMTVEPTGNDPLFFTAEPTVQHEEGKP